MKRTTLAVILILSLLILLATGVQIVKAQYTVTFAESGLPLGTPWEAILNTQPVSQQVSTSFAITFTNVSAGNYSWNIPNAATLNLYYGTITDYSASPNSGTIRISSLNSPYLQQTTFSPISTPSPSPSPTISLSPIASPSPTVSPSPTPIVPEFQSLTILALCVGMISQAVALITRKKRKT